MKTRRITIEDLARMVKKGFDGTDKKIEKGFKEVNMRLDRIENFILKQHSQKIEFLEKRINRLEETLAIK
jgi:polyhydroxyalkanoate synthesis regulator phasin